VESCAYGETIDCHNHNRRSSIAEEVERGCVKLLLMFPTIYANEEKAIRRLKEKFAEEQKKICQTMGWRDYNQGNLSAFDGDLGPVEVKMRQIIQEQDEKKDEKDKVKARQKRLGEIGAVSLDVRTEGSLKPKNKRSNPLKNIISGSSKSSVPDSQEEDEVHIYLFFIFYFFICACSGRFLKRKRLL